MTEKDAHASGGSPFSIRVTNTHADVYWANAFLPLISPFNYLMLGLYGFMMYTLAGPWLREGNVVLFLLVAAGEAIVIIVILHAIPLLVPLYGKLFNRLQGVVGEHEFVFTGDQFVERTAFNETKMSKAAIQRVLDTGKHFFLVFPGPQAHFIPKRDLTEGEIGELTRRLGDIRPIRRFWSVWCVRAYFVVCVLYLAGATQLRHYEAQSDIRPFHACWDDETLYVMGGEQFYGTTYQYADVVLERSGGMEIIVSSDNVLWSASNGEVERYELDMNGFVGSVLLDDSRLYLSAYDETMPAGQVLVWSGDRFVEAREMSSERMAELALDEAKEDEACASWIDADSFAFLTDGSDTLEVPLAGGTFVLTYRETVTDEETWDRDVSLEGAWVGADAPAAFDFAASTGSLDVNGETFTARFAGASR